jgi:DnaJ-like protein
MSVLVLPYRCHDCHLRFFEFRWPKVATLWRQPSGTRGGRAAAGNGAAIQNPALGQQTLHGGATPVQEPALGEQATPRSAGATQNPGLEPATPLAADSPAGLVLGVSEHATPEEVSVAYRRLARLYHPDKVAGLAPEFQALAEKRMKEINAAYAVLKQRG